MRNFLTVCATAILALTLGTAAVAQNRDSDGEVISVIYGHLGLDKLTFYKRNIETAAVTQNRDSDGEVISVMYGHPGLDKLTFYKRNLVNDFKTPSGQPIKNAQNNGTLLNTTGLRVQLRQKQHQAARVNPQSFALE